MFFPNKLSHLMRLWYVFVLHKLIVQTCMRSHPVELDIWFLVGPFIYFHTSCVQTGKALARLRECAGLPEPSLVTYAISTIISWAGSIGKNTSTPRKFSTCRKTLEAPKWNFVKLPPRCCCQTLVDFQISVALFILVINDLTLAY